MQFAARAAYRGQLTKIVNAPTEFLDANASTNKFDEIEEEMRAFIQRLKGLNDSFCTVKQTIQKRNSAIQTIKCLKYRIKSLTANIVQSRLYQLKLLNTVTPHLIIHTFTFLLPCKIDSFHAKLTLQHRKFGGSTKDWLLFLKQLCTSAQENEGLTLSKNCNYSELELLGISSFVW